MTRTIWPLLFVCLATAVTATTFEINPALPPITDKTLAVWCRLDNLDQRGGSVLTLEKDDRFDGLVFGEVAPRTWMAGLQATGATEIRFRQTSDEPDSGYTLNINPGAGEISIGNGHETHRRTCPWACRRIGETSA